MRQSYFKNAALLTGSDVVLRLEEGRARVLKSSIALVAGAKAVNGTVEAKPEVRATV